MAGSGGEEACRRLGDGVSQGELSLLERARQRRPRLGWTLMPPSFLQAVMGGILLSFGAMVSTF